MIGSLHRQAPPSLALVCCQTTKQRNTRRKRSHGSQQQTSKTKVNPHAIVCAICSCSARHGHHAATLCQGTTSCRQVARAAPQGCPKPAVNGPATSYTVVVASGSAHARVCASSRELSLWSAPRAFKHLCLSLPAGAFTDYILAHPAGQRVVVAAAPKAQRLEYARTVLEVGNPYFLFHLHLGMLLVFRDLMLLLGLSRFLVHLTNIVVLLQWVFLLAPCLLSNWLALALVVLAL